MQRHLPFFRFLFSNVLGEISSGKRKTIWRSKEVEHLYLVLFFATTCALTPKEQTTF
jgi:hypothetical protein